MKATFLSIPEQGYFVDYSRNSRKSDYAHIFCGPHSIEGAGCPNCHKPLLRLFSFDVRDPCLQLAPAPFTALPVLFCWTCNVAQSLFYYRINDDRGIRLLKYMEGGGTGRDLIDALKELSKAGPIDIVNIYSHGFPAGIIGASQNNTGLYIEYIFNEAYRRLYTFEDGRTDNIDVRDYIDINTGQPRQDGAATAKDLVEAIANGSINIAPDGQINLFGCSQDDIASHLSYLLNQKGRGDINVRGGTGQVNVGKSGPPIVGTGRINSYRGGRYQGSSVRW